MNSLSFSLAGLRFQIDALPGLPPLRPPDEYTPFVRQEKDSGPDALYEALLAEDLPATRQPRDIAWDNGLWRTRSRESGVLEIDILNPQTHAWQRAASMSGDFSKGSLLVPATDRNAGSLRPLYHPQDRAVILGRVCHLGGIMLHASSVIVDNKVLVFAGMSGTGKTTMGRLWQNHGGILLNDERTLIHTARGQAMAGASPWHGEENRVSPATGPLAGLFFLHPSTANRLHPLSVVEATAKMITTAFVPVFLPDGPELTLAACHAILETVPAYDLDFTPDHRAIDLCAKAAAVAGS